MLHVYGCGSNMRIEQMIACLSLKEAYERTKSVLGLWQHTGQWHWGSWEVLGCYVPWWEHLQSLDILEKRLGIPLNGCMEMPNVDEQSAVDVFF